MKPLAVPPNAKTPMLFLGKAMKSRMVVCEVAHKRATKLGAAWNVVPTMWRYKTKRSDDTAQNTKHNLPRVKMNKLGQRLT